MVGKELYGLLGRKLGHSFSPRYFNSKFKNEGIDAAYELFEIPEITHLTEIITAHPTLMGLNVTIPYKQEVLPYLNSVDKVAQRIGAVNVIKINRQGDDFELKGFNTDQPAFRQSIEPLLRKDLTHKALILGTGGASKAVAVTFEQLGIPYQFVSRTPGEKEISYDQLTKEVVENTTVIVNTTPLGMYPNIEVAPPIPYHWLNERHLCYDLIYNPEETLFMRKASERGALTKNGQEMLERQAAASWLIWQNEEV